MRDLESNLEGAVRGLIRANRAAAVPTAKQADPVEVEKSDEDNGDGDADGESVSITADIVKANTEKREVTGVVLQPEVTDAQGDIIGEDVIEQAAGDFLASFNKSTTLGLQHKAFNKRFELRQSFIAPSDMVIANKTVRKGSWLMVVKVLDDKVWQAVKDAKVTGFSIGGKAKVKQLTEE